MESRVGFKTHVAALSERLMARRGQETIVLIANNPCHKVLMAKMPWVPKAHSSCKARLMCGTLDLSWSSVMARLRTGNCTNMALGSRLSPSLLPPQKGHTVMLAMEARAEGVKEDTENLSVLAKRNVGFMREVSCAMEWHGPNFPIDLVFGLPVLGWPPRSVVEISMEVMNTKT